MSFTKRDSQQVLRSGRGVILRLGDLRVLEKLGMTFERMFPMNPGEPEVRLYGRTLDAASG